ncbi:MAG TPA: hypothetical protein VHK01_22055, partial [Lacipirellulaceae bacterium]|nr:hypothetical protein [Lacipirellulaceae bacterium]
LAIWILALQAAFVGVGRAQTNEDEKKTPPVDPAGTWNWEYTFNDNAAKFELKLKWDDEKLTGKYTAFENTTDIEDVKLEKDQLSFVTAREFQGNKFQVHFNGKVQPDEITGTVSINRDGNGLREFDWNAKRVVEIDDVIGTWQLRVETPNGAVEPRLTVTADGDKLSGKSVSDAFGELEAKNVKLKDNTLTWEVSVVNNGIEFNIKYAGKPRGNTMDGSNEFTVGENTGTMKFTGKRMPPEEKDEKQPADQGKPAATPESQDSAAQ